jgi:hypothetical protein
VPTAALPRDDQTRSDFQNDEIAHAFFGGSSSKPGRGSEFHPINGALVCPGHHQWAMRGALLTLLDPSWSADLRQHPGVEVVTKAADDDLGEVRP